jgi:pimeloyl-ACP methyl ester carboxylesterase
MNDEEAQKYYGLLVVESPQIVAETAGWLTQLDPGAIKAPVLVLADDHDVLIPLEPLKRYADLLHADFEVVKGVGHIDMLVKEHDWRAGALEVLKWLKKG